MKRTIVHIDEDKCDGCGLCIPSCAEGALKIVDGKARLVSDVYCDGLGDCLAECPRGAITLEEREADPFDARAVEERLEQLEDEQPEAATSGCPTTSTCPGAALRFAGEDSRPAPGPSDNGSRERATQPSQLNQWPVQMALLPEQAPFYDQADLLLAADCVPFACADFHPRYLAGRTLLVGCPKLDDARMYIEKLAAILSKNDIRSLTVLHMEVPCCHGLVRIAREAIQASGKDLRVERKVIGVGGSEA